jgi:hypothetical protein
LLSSFRFAPPLPATTRNGNAARWNPDARLPMKCRRTAVAHLLAAHGALSQTGGPNNGLANTGESPLRAAALPRAIRMLTTGSRPPPSRTSKSTTLATLPTKSKTSKIVLIPLQAIRLVLLLLVRRVSKSTKLATPPLRPRTSTELSQLRLSSRISQAQASRTQRSYDPLQTDYRRRVWDPEEMAITAGGLLQPHTSVASQILRNKYKVRA